MILMMLVFFRSMILIGPNAVQEQHHATQMLTCNALRKCLIGEEILGNCGVHAKCVTAVLKPRMMLSKTKKENYFSKASNWVKWTMIKLFFS